MTGPPKRIQLRRTKGWRKPDGAIVVSRPSKWGNPWRPIALLDPSFPFSRTVDVLHVAGGSLGRVHPEYGKQVAVDGYRLHLTESGLIEQVRILAGHDLACWCPLDQPCHGDVLLELANR